ncbi:MAG: biosynthetic arginine decarboxylase [Verrucomicrobiales bacterium]
MEKLKSLEPIHPRLASTPDKWSVEEARALYGIDRWGQGYYSVNEDGEVCADLEPQEGGPIVRTSIDGLIRDLKKSHPDLTLPLLFRFSDILHSRIEELNLSFQKAITEHKYKGRYRGVYPIKVNQQHQVISEVASFGRAFHYGFEAGSKPELLAALAYMHDPEALIVCNGYKDREFIDLAFGAVKMGLKVVIVMEMPDELPLIMESAESFGIEPLLGVRIRLSGRSGGHWANSAGDRSPFGLSLPQLMRLVDELRGRGRLHWLRLLHFHQGSQIPKIQTIRQSATEAARVYVSLVKEGAPMGYIDLGGGLAVDYDGSGSSNSSKNYATQEYCSDMVHVLTQVCDEAKVPHPDVVTESGRAVASYFSVLVFNVLGTTRLDLNGSADVTLPDDANMQLRSLYEVLGNLDTLGAQECYNDAVFYRDGLRQLFTLGVISLRETALGEEIFWRIMTRIAAKTRGSKSLPKPLKDIRSSLADFYYGNFSIFQSLPDSWAIDQLFPVMPMHRLCEAPTREAVISDLTCDCDGVLDHFTGNVRENVLPVHQLNEEGDYHLGVFLVGAYQESLGGLHNLFGDTNVVSVKLENGIPKCEVHYRGDTVGDVLSYMEYNPAALTERFTIFAERALADGHITAQEKSRLVHAYRNGMAGYTYFEG